MLAKLSRLIRLLRHPLPAAALAAAAAAVVATVAMALILGSPGGGRQPTSGQPTRAAGYGGEGAVLVGSPLPTPVASKTGKGIPIATGADSLPGTDVKSLNLPRDFGRIRILPPQMPKHEPSALPPPAPGLVQLSAQLQEITDLEQCQRADLYVKVDPPPGMQAYAPCQVDVHTWSDGRTTESRYAAPYREAALGRSFLVARWRLAPGDALERNVAHTDDPNIVLAPETITEVHGVPVFISQDVPGGKVYQIYFVVGDVGNNIGSINVDLGYLLSLAGSIIDHDLAVSP